MRAWLLAAALAVAAGSPAHAAAVAIDAVAAAAVGDVGLEAAVVQAAAVEAPQRPVCPPPPARCSCTDDAVIDEYYCTIDSDKKLVITFSERYFRMRCPPGLALDSASLPRFLRPLRAQHVALARCAPPRRGYARALAALNVSAPTGLSLQLVPDAPALTRAHLRALPGLRQLDVAAAEAARPLRAADDFLAPASELRNLFLTDVLLPPAALLALPATLVQLSVVRAGLRELPAPVLERLPGLRWLRLEEDGLREPPALAAAPALRDVTLAAPLRALPPLHRLENATLRNVLDAQLTGECGALRRLALEQAPLLKALPARWLATARCERLEVLALRSLPQLNALNVSLLAGAGALAELSVHRCGALFTLPAGLFEGAPALRRLDLSYNSLMYLPPGLFSPLTQLQELDLTRNRLGELPNLLGHVLSPLRALDLSLTVLVLNDNPLGDLCGDGTKDIQAREHSVLQPLKKLRTLSLARTGASRLCADWQNDLHELRALDLSENNVAVLQARRDLQWASRAAPEPLHLDLRGNPLTAVEMSRGEYEAAAVAVSRDAAPRVAVRVDALLHCDCFVYWFARALRDQLLRASFPDLCCEPAPGGAGDGACSARGGRRGQPLRTLPEDRMVCADLEGCAAGCTCLWRPRDDAAVLTCERTALTRLPPVPPRLRDAARLELRLRGNNISALHAAELPPALRLLDLRDNQLAALDAAATRALFAQGGREVLLARNPLACDCALLHELHVHASQVDYDNVTCAGGQAAREAARRAACGAGAGEGAAAGAAAGVLAAALLLAGAAWCAARRDSRLWLKACLLRRNLCRRWAQPDDSEDAKYDAFLSFSHLDGAVAEQLVAELEGGARPLRLCVHHRDWRAGDWIPAQIARSVAQSRRTVVLLSENFVSSGWARAEFREAHARALRDTEPRLVVVLLGAAPPPGLDRELRHYVRSHTYVTWGEPGFWDKLRLALPPGREPRKSRAGEPPAQAGQPAPLSPPAPAAREEPPARDGAPAPPTPIVKFSQIEFPTVIKTKPAETSPCA